MCSGFTGRQRLRERREDSTFGLRVRAWIWVAAPANRREQPPSEATGPMAVKAEVLQTQIMHEVPPIYPESAKEAQIVGKVKLEAVIGKAGEIENLKVVSGPKNCSNPPSTPFGNGHTSPSS